MNPYRLLAKCGGEVLAKRIKPDVLGWNKALVAGGFLAAPGSAANVDPVGGLIASALVALIFHKGFEQHRAKAVSAKPVIGQLAGGKGQNLRSQPFALDPGQDQEARIVDHQLQVFLTLRFTPADEALPVLQLPGACTEADAGNELLTGKDVVANLAARHGRVTQVVVARDIFVPQP